MNFRSLTLAYFPEQRPRMKKFLEQMCQKLTTVRPIIKGDTPKFCARPDAPSTNLSAPQINPTNPSIIIIVAMSIDFRIYAVSKEPPIRRVFDCVCK